MRAVASAKDSRRTSVIADLQDTLEVQKQQLEQLQLQQAQKLPLKEEDDDEEDDDNEDALQESKGGLITPFLPSPYSPCRYQS